MSLRPLSSSLARALVGAALLTACGDDLPATTDISSSSSSGSSGSTTNDPSDATTTTLPTTSIDPTTTTAPTTTTDPTTTTTDPTDPTTTTTETDPTTGSTGSTGDTDTTTASTGDTDTTTGGPGCGNGIIEDGEVCDDGINDGSYNGCNPDCQALGPFCGDAVLTEPEQCDDGNDDNDDECTQVCAPPACGDTLVQANEECDGENLAGADCVSLGFIEGILGCTPELCTFDTSTCQAGNAECGNAVREAPELCDGADFGGQTCADVDPNLFAGGELTCAATCDAIDSTTCDSGNCCQVGVAGSCDVPAILACVCDQDDFCCNNSWDGICVEEAKSCGAVCPCGDGIIGPGEVCDSDDLAGETCMSQGFEAGTLACSDTCEVVDTSGCGASCCVPAGPGECSDPAVLDCVCGLDPFCCDVEWDGFCVDEAVDCGAQCN